MADMQFEDLVVAPQLRGPSATQVEERDRNWRASTRDAKFLQPVGGLANLGDKRVFFVHDGTRCGETGVTYEQSSSSPLFVFIADDVPDLFLAKVAVRNGLVLDKLIEFRDHVERDLSLAKPADKVR